MTHAVVIRPLTITAKALDQMWRRVNRMGSRHAYEEAARIGKSSTYHFKGAHLADGGRVRTLPPAGSGVNLAPYERSILQYAAGRVLDIGCGEGRVAIFLMQHRSPPVQEIVGVDTTPTALDRYAAHFEQAHLQPCITWFGDIKADDWYHLGIFDTLLLCGNNFGIASNFDDLVQLLQKLKALTHRESILLGSSRHPTHPMTPVEELEVSHRNLTMGFGAGERWLRLTYEPHDSGWVQWYYPSPKDIEEAAHLSGWALDSIVFEVEGGQVVETTSSERFETEGEKDEYGVMLSRGG